MLAVKNRRASDYVLQSPAPKAAVVVALADDAAIGAVASPARQLQAELAARLAGETSILAGHSLRWRVAMICGAAIVAWMPLVLAASLVFA